MWWQKAEGVSLRMHTMLSSIVEFKPWLLKIGCSTQVAAWKVTERESSMERQEQLLDSYAIQQESSGRRCKIGTDGVTT